MTEPLPPLFTADIARQSTLTVIRQALADLTAILSSVNGKLDIIMSQDAAVAATTARLEAAATAEAAAISALQGLVVALRNEPGPLSPEVLAALETAEAHVTAATATGTADVAADIPPAPPSGA